MKIAFYLPNKNCRIDCSKINEGNPGIGGTEYMIITIAYQLSIRQTTHSIALFAQELNGLPQNLDKVKITDIKDALEKSLANNFDCLVAQNNKEIDTIFKYDLKKLKLIMWGHSCMPRRELNLYASSNNVSRVVCVGNEEPDLYYDHKAFFKTAVIFNAFPFTNKTLSIPDFSERKKRSNIFS